MHLLTAFNFFVVHPASADLHCRFRRLQFVVTNNEVSSLQILPVQNFPGVLPVGHLHSQTEYHFRDDAKGRDQAMRHLLVNLVIATLPLIFEL